MAGNKVDALEERLEGEVGNLKSAFGDRISMIENRFSGIEEMLKKVLDAQTITAASEARAPSIGQRCGGNPNIGGRREDQEEEVMGEDEDLPYLESFPKRGGEESYGRRRYGKEEDRRVNFGERKTWRENRYQGGGRQYWGGGDPRVRKLKMPVFEGEDAHGWIYRVERYFAVNGLSEEE